MEPNCFTVAMATSNRPIREFCLMIQFWERILEICFHSAIDLSMHKLTAKGNYFYIIAFLSYGCLSASSYEICHCELQAFEVSA